MNRPTWRFIPCRCRRQAPFKMCEGSKPKGQDPAQPGLGSREPGPALPDAPVKLKAPTETKTVACSESKRKPNNQCQNRVVRVLATQ